MTQQTAIESALVKYVGITGESHEAIPSGTLFITPVVGGMSPKQILKEFRSRKLALRKLKSDFEGFVRAHRFDDVARQAYAVKANAEYFDIIKRMDTLKSAYRVCV